MNADVLGVGEAQDGVDAITVGDLWVDEERESHGSGVGEARRLDDDVVELLRLVLDGEKRADQVAAHGAAHASVVHRDHVLLLRDVLADRREGAIEHDDRSTAISIATKDTLERERRLIGVL